MDSFLLSCGIYNIYSLGEIISSKRHEKGIKIILSAPQFASQPKNNKLYFSQLLLFCFCKAELITSCHESLEKKV